MSEKILLRADAHCHPHAGSSRRAVECIEALRWSYEVALERGCRHLVDLGDVFHERHHLDTWTYTEVYELTKEYLEKGVRTHFVLGNHDMYLRDERRHNAIVAFENVARVISEPTTIELRGRSFDCMPYVETNPQRALVKAFPKKSSVLFFHAAIDGAIMSSASGMRRKPASPPAPDMHEEEASESVSQEGLDGWKVAWGGHYHLPQTICSKPCHAQYVGSLLQHNRGEAGERKRVVLLDVEDLSYKDVYNDVSPVYLKLNADSENPIPENFEPARSRVFVFSSDPGSTSTQAVCRELRKMGALQVTVEPRPQTTIDREVQRAGLRDASALLHDGAAMVRRYAKLQAPADLNQKRLVEVGMKIVTLAETGVTQD
jgi:DNA repair exonuclease SbcCD nuclease subunit